MAFIVADRVRDTSTTTGTGAVTVSGTPPTRHRTFADVCATNDTLPYFIENRSANEWEVGIGTYSASNQLTRTTVLSSSNANAAVSFSAGTKDVVLGIPARNAYADVANKSSDWTNWTPTLSADGGTITTSSVVYARYSQANKTVSFYFVCLITTVGTATGALIFTLPTTAGYAPVFLGTDNFAGELCFGLTSTGTANVRVLEYDGTTPLHDGTYVFVNGTYESQ